MFPALGTSRPRPRDPLPESGRPLACTFGGGILTRAQFLSQWLGGALLGSRVSHSGFCPSTVRFRKTRSIPTRECLSSGHNKLVLLRFSPFEGRSFLRFPLPWKEGVVENKFPTGNLKKDREISNLETGGLPATRMLGCRFFLLPGFSPSGGASMFSGSVSPVYFGSTGNTIRPSETGCPGGAGEGLTVFGGVPWLRHTESGPS